MPTTNSSASPGAERLQRVPLDRLRPHPANANLMSAERRAKLQANIARAERYPPIVARPHPDEPQTWQILDGHQRWQVLQALGHADALVFPWDCDDATALLLLSTLNRLAGDAAQAVAELEGPNRRGRALGVICRAYLATSEAPSDSASAS